MDHSYAEEHDLVEAYLAERLSESEREAFEAHYFNCEICLERLETANDFREGMRQVAAEDIAQAAAAHVQIGLLAGLAALSRRHRLALAGILLLLAALPLWLIESNRGLERQRTALEARLRRLEEAQAGDRRRHAEELAQAQQAHAPRKTTAVQPVQPQVNVPLFLLAAVRSGDAGREPVSQIPLSPTATSVILTAELATVDFTTYRASLRASGKEIWQAGGLHPDSRDTLVLLLPASMLQPGVYQLTIEGAKSDGSWSVVAGYPFRVVLPKAAG
ncbi:MAG TPA: zf-HC2 domain-containing protein [Thermoanaerobaculia bacterium]|nr:zf-HC2 domain-containing protein [Thermoanaerobaculia bacterium]